MRSCLLVVEAVVCMFLLFCEVDMSHGIVGFLVGMALTKLAGVLLMACIIAEAEQWWENDTLNKICGR
ncbi:MAG: hypothetical protein IJR87_00630 [Bacteroidaceae bacterium]|nr:hypothetical protein [Bacteroidaceae bacterium]